MLEIESVASGMLVKHSPTLLYTQEEKVIDFNVEHRLDRLTVNLQGKLLA
jgi:hypothetical protein